MRTIYYVNTPIGWGYNRWSPLMGFLDKTLDPANAQKSVNKRVATPLWEVSDSYEMSLYSHVRLHEAAIAFQKAVAESGEKLPVDVELPRGVDVAYATHTLECYKLQLEVESWIANHLNDIYIYEQHILELTRKLQQGYGYKVIPKFAVEDWNGKDWSGRLRKEIRDQFSVEYEDSELADLVAVGKLRRLRVHQCHLYAHVVNEEYVDCVFTKNRQGWKAYGTPALTMTSVRKAWKQFENLTEWYVGRVQQACG